MKQIILSLCAFCLLALSAGAQSAQAEFEASLPDSVKYVMPAFGPGNILYKDGGFSRGSFNICTVDNTLRYIDTDESEKVLADPSQVESVSISGVLFLHTQNMYLGVVGDYDDVLLCVDKRLVFDDRKVGAYGTSSATSSIRTVGASTESGSTFRFSNVKYEVRETPYLYKKGRVYVPSKKTLTKLFPAKKADIEAYVQENRVEFSDYHQVEALLEKLK
jgi:hypothetical protein